MIICIPRSKQQIFELKQHLQASLVIYPMYHDFIIDPQLKRKTSFFLMLLVFYLGKTNGHKHHPPTHDSFFWCYKPFPNDQIRVVVLLLLLLLLSFYPHLYVSLLPWKQQLFFFPSIEFHPVSLASANGLTSRLPTARHPALQVFQIRVIKVMPTCCQRVLRCFFRHPIKTSLNGLA